MPSTLSPNMGLIVPGVGTEPGPDWATDLNASLGILDQHNHSSGSGVQITPTGININADLAINSNNLTSVKTVNFTALGSSLAGVSPNLGCTYVAGNELYYNDEVGNVVQITNNGSVNSGAGSITGLPSGTASASYSAGSGKFIWQSATSTPASMDFGSAIFRNIVANSKGLTLNPPNAMASDYSLTLPSLPGSTLAMTLDTSGNMGTATFDTLAAGVTSVGANTIANARTRASNSATVGIGGVAISAGSGSFATSSGSYVNIPNQSVTITTSGRPVMVMMINDSAANLGGSIYARTTTNTAGTFVQILGAGGAGTFIYELYSDATGAAPEIRVPLGSVAFVDTTINGSPGTYTYTAQMYLSQGTTCGVNYSRLVAYEL